MNKLFSKLWASGLLATALALPGCCCTHDRDAATPQQVQHGPLPAYADVAAAYNARVVRLERLTANVGVVVHAKDDNGNPFKEQVESYLQLALPSSVALRLTKVGETVFYLGSNAQKYWWFDLTGDKEALVGSHALARPETVAAFGVPVHPLDLLEVLAIKPIPGGAAQQAEHAKLEWSADGRWIVLTLPGRWGGTRRFYLAPSSYDPARIELRNQSDEVLVAAALSVYIPVEVLGDTRVHPRIASRIDVELPREQATTNLIISQAQNPGDKQKPKAFDVDSLLQYYRISKVIDLDKPPPANTRASAEEAAR